jgi:hypothetical protein
MRFRPNDSSAQTRATVARAAKLKREPRKGHARMILRLWRGGGARCADGGHQGESDGVIPVLIG